MIRLSHTSGGADKGVWDIHEMMISTRKKKKVKVKVKPNLSLCLIRGRVSK
jgi:hypothetical protein